MPPTEAAPGAIGIFSHGETFGDGLYKVVFLRGLRAAFPAARLTWLSSGSSVFAGSLAPVAATLLDRVIEHCGIGASVRELAAPAPRLGQFDLLIDTQTVGWRTLSLWRLPHGRFITGLFGSGRPAPHVLDRLFALLGRASGRAVTRDLSPLTLPAALTVAAAAALPPGPGYVALAPGSGRAEKCWPLENFLALGAGLVAQGRVPVFLLGPQEAGWQERIAAVLPSAVFPESHPAFALDATAPAPLRAVAAAARCQAGVANDAGAGHMIAAAGIPLLSLFGPTSAAKFRPVAVGGVVLRAQDFGGDAMANIPVAAAAAALETLLRPGARRCREVAEPTP